MLTTNWKIYKKKKSENVIVFQSVHSILIQPQGNLELKFEKNLLNRFWDNCDTDWRRVDDGKNRFHKLCRHSQAELKIEKFTKKNKNQKMWFFFQKCPSPPLFSHRGSHNWNLKGICSIGSEIIATRTDDGKFRFHELCWHSQAELKI